MKPNIFIIIYAILILSLCYTQTPYVFNFCSGHFVLSLIGKAISQPIAYEALYLYYQICILILSCMLHTKRLCLHLRLQITFFCLLLAKAIRLQIAYEALYLYCHICYFDIIYCITHKHHISSTSAPDQFFLSLIGKS